VYIYIYQLCMFQFNRNIGVHFQINKASHWTNLLSFRFVVSLVNYLLHVFTKIQVLILLIIIIITCKYNDGSRIVETNRDGTFTGCFWRIRAKHVFWKHKWSGTPADNQGYLSASCGLKIHTPNRDAFNVRIRNI